MRKRVLVCHSVVGFRKRLVFIPTVLKLVDQFLDFLQHKREKERNGLRLVHKDVRCSRSVETQHSVTIDDTTLHATSCNIVHKTTCLRCNAPPVFRNYR